MKKVDKDLFLEFTVMVTNCIYILYINKISESVVTKLKGLKSNLKFMNSYALTHIKSHIHE